MNTTIVHSSAPILLVGGGDAKSLDFQEVLAIAPHVVAVDGGAGLALSQGLQPLATIGDFDSLSDDSKARLPTDRLFRIAEQDSTDFDKALRHVRAPLVLGAGFLGARLDHQLAALHSLLRRPERPCILIGPEELVFLAPPAVELPTEAADIVSFFPMRGVTATASGLIWPLAALALDPVDRIGTSNEATGPVAMTVDAPGLIVMLPRRRLARLAQAILQQTARWPARA
jgi:thiamine pyrophosphokinase